MKVTHTPGPWVVVKNSLGCAAHVRAGERIIGGFTCDPFGGFHPHDDPDAHLIAAAPDLLAACVAMHDFMSDWNDDLKQLKRQLGDAIEKARGGA